MIKKRYLYKYIAEDLKEKMVFIGGPRQVGKTTLAEYVGKKKYENYEYLNWDDRQDRKNIIESKFSSDARLIIFDEIHKYRTWKNYIKGLFDKYKDRFNILVTGSARLDLYRKGGDSLMGRYHYYKLHPFSMGEALDLNPAVQIFKELNFVSSNNDTIKLFDALLHFGGFPEPFIKQDEKTLRRFHNEYIDRLVKEDIRDINQIRDLSSLQVLVEILPEKVGSLLSLHSLQEDLQVAHKTVSSWIDILERFYFLFRLHPFSFSTIKSLRRQPKMYLWDWSQIKDKDKRLENLIASALLKTAHFLHDAEGYKTQVTFLRDIEGREVDFLVLVDKKPWIAVEVKNSKTSISSSLKYFGSKLNIPYKYQIVGEKNIDFFKDDIRVISADKFLTGLA
ncbi:MAG: ATP-binding protein [Armatimonadota bacterium]